MVTPDRLPEPEEGRGSQGDPSGGAERVPEHPPDSPGRSRTVALAVVAVLVALVLAVPVAWGLGVLVEITEFAGGAATILVWVIWVLVVLTLVWALRSLWRGAA